MAGERFDVDFICPRCDARVAIELGPDGPNEFVSIACAMDGWYVMLDGAVVHDCRRGGGGEAGDREPRRPHPPFFEDEQIVTDFDGGGWPFDADEPSASEHFGSPADEAPFR